MKRVAIASLALLALLALVACKKKIYVGMTSEIEETHKRRIAYCETFVGESYGAAKQACYDHLAVEKREMGLCDRGSPLCPARIASLTGKWQGCERRRTPSAECFMLAAAAGAGMDACDALRDEAARLVDTKDLNVTSSAEGMKQAAALCQALAKTSEAACTAMADRSDVIGCLNRLALATRDASLCAKIPGRAGETTNDSAAGCYIHVAQETGSLETCTQAAIAAGAQGRSNLCMASVRPAAVTGCLGSECAATFAREAGDPSLCSKPTSPGYNAYVQERCYADFVARGGAGTACAQIVKHPDLKTACEKIANL